jgi:hypothetical protein
LPGLASSHDPPDLCLLGLQVWATGTQLTFTHNQGFYYLICLLSCNILKTSWQHFFDFKNSYKKHQMFSVYLVLKIEWLTSNINTEVGDWQSGSSERVPPWQVWHPEFKTPVPPKKKKKETEGLTNEKVKKYVNVWKITMKPLYTTNTH